MNNKELRAYAMAVDLVDSGVVIRLLGELECLKSQQETYRIMVGTIGYGNYQGDGSDLNDEALYSVYVVRREYDKLLTSGNELANGSEVKILRARVEELEDGLILSDSLHTATKQELSNAEFAASVWMKDNEELRTQLDSVIDSNAACGQLINELRTRNAKLQVHMNTCHGEIEQLRTRLATEQENHAATAKQNEYLSARLAKYEPANEAAKACPYAIIDVLTDELKRSQTDRDEMVDEVARLESRLAELSKSRPNKEPTVVGTFQVYKNSWTDFEINIYSDGTLRAVLESVGGVNPPMEEVTDGRKMK